VIRSSGGPGLVFVVVAIMNALVLGLVLSRLKPLRRRLLANG
jgi:hypothetical protein